MSNFGSVTIKRSKAVKQVNGHREKLPEEDFVTQNRALKKIINALDPKKNKSVKTTNNSKNK